MFWQVINNKLLAGFELQCRVVNKPYDIYGTWYNDQHLLSGDLHWLAHLVSTSSLWLNKASQEAESEHVPITHNMFRFYNRNASSIRAIMIANCLPNSEVAPEVKENEIEADPTENKSDTFEHGNPVSHRDINSIPCTHSASGIYSAVCRKVSRLSVVNMLNVIRQRVISNSYRKLPTPLFNIIIIKSDFLYRRTYSIYIIITLCDFRDDCLKNCSCVAS
jgi:hypothetical protein